MEASRHSAEDRRVAALHAYDILDTPREEEFDEIVKVVSAICGTPIAVINLIDRERQWFKAELGLGVRETPLPASICAHAILQPDLFVVPDTLDDARFADNPLVVGQPHLRFYAGALLETSEGLPLGTICVLDYKPRQLDDNQKALIRLMARQIMKLFELRRVSANERTAREQFIAVLGHDLRNPLASIKAGSELLKRGTPASQEILQLMDGSVSRMSAMIDDILDLARGRLGSGIDITRREVQLEPFLLQVVDELRATQPDRAIISDIDLDGTVYCDPGRLGQLLSNLLANALTHGDGGAPIRVHARARSGVFDLTVSNVGTAIPPAALDKLFQPFFRGEVRVSQQGLGLGLYIASEIARSHEGTLTATSTKEMTVFAFRMPAGLRQASGA